MLFQPVDADARLWDTWLYWYRDLYHLFFLRRDLREPARTGVGHAVSEDLMRWTELEPALYVGSPGEWDHVRGFLTGMTLTRDDRHYMLFGARDKGVEKLGVATSIDLVHWEKHPDNPIAVPDSRWYEADPGASADGVAAFRDPCVLRDGEGYIAYMCARLPYGPYGGRGTVATLRSPDLLRWEVGPPVDVPRGFHAMEVPDLFQMGDRWFLLHSTGLQFGTRLMTFDPGLVAGTHVLWATERDGPYTRPPRDVLVGSPAGRLDAYVCRTVETPLGRIAYYHNVYPGAPLGSVMNAQTPRRGSFGLPKGLAADEEGVRLRYLPLLEPYRGAPLAPPLVAVEKTVQHPAPGEWLVRETSADGRVAVGTSDLVLRGEAEDLLLTAAVTLVEGRGAGIAFREDEYGNGHAVVLDARAGTIGVADLGRAAIGVAWHALSERRLHIRHGVPQAVRVVVLRDVVEVFVDGDFMLSVVVEGRRPGRLALFADDAHVRFDEVQVWRLDVPDVVEGAAGTASLATAPGRRAG